MVHPIGPTSVTDTAYTIPPPITATATYGYPYPATYPLSGAHPGGSNKMGPDPGPGGGGGSPHPNPPNPPSYLHTNMTTPDPGARSRTAIATTARTRLQTPTDPRTLKTHPRHPIVDRPRVSTPIRNPPRPVVTIGVSYAARKATGGPIALRTRSRNKRSPSSNEEPPP
ncbi:hypothetical protein AeRB84_019786 [Aphanomyces euteiches]|nr:hypothetical protein AeRB84_019786 [Aphanomyces euteiches]